MSEQTSSRVSTIAGKIMADARKGGILQARRVELVGVIAKAIQLPKHYPMAVTEDERRIDALISHLQPIIDEIEALAGSAMSQDETPGQA